MRRLIPRPIRNMRWRLPWLVEQQSLGVSTCARMLWFSVRELLHPVFSFRSPDGLTFWTMRNNFSSFAMYALGQRDPNVWQAMRRHVKPGDVVVDVGANIGSYALPAATLVGDAGRVLAIEAHPGTAALLERSVAANGLGCVEVVICAMGAGSGVVGLTYVAANPGETHVRLDGAGSLEVPMRRLDDVLGERGLRDVSYLKIDVEGFELAVLQGAAETLQTSRNIIVQTEILGPVDRFGHAGPELARFLDGFGFRPHIAAPDGELIPAPRPLRGDVLWRRSNG